jgi:hypothetical protein
MQLAAIGPVQASFTETLQETFQSGASFSGTITFDSATFTATGVTGTLSGYQYGTTGFVGGSATDNINWVFDPTFNSSTLPLVSTILVDADPNSPSAFGTPGGIYNSIFVTLDFSNPLAPVFTTTPGDNSVNLSDAPVPIPATLSLIALGGLGMRFKRQKPALA